MSTPSYVAEPALAAAQKYREHNMGIPVDTEVAFSDHRHELNGNCKKRQSKLLSKLGFIRPFLEEGEVVVLVTTACSPLSVWEQLVGGWIIFLLKRSLLVFTNKRIFHVPTSADFAYRQSIAVVEYSGCREVRVKGAALQITYHTGQSERFMCVDSRERKKLKAMFIDTPLPVPEENVGTRTFLCPNCGQAMGTEVVPCVHCGQSFRDQATMRKLSLLFPGGGYFYTRHPVLGILDALVETVLSVYVLLGLVSVIAGHPEGMAEVVLYACILAMEKGVTIYECSHFIREFIPQRRQSRSRASVMPAPDVVSSQREKIPVEVLPDSTAESILRAGESL